MLLCWCATSRASRCWYFSLCLARFYMPDASRYMRRATMLVFRAAAAVPCFAAMAMFWCHRHAAHVAAIFDTPFDLFCRDYTLICVAYAPCACASIIRCCIYFAISRDAFIYMPLPLDATDARAFLSLICCRFAAVLSRYCCLLRAIRYVDAVIIMLILLLPRYSFSPWFRRFFRYYARRLLKLALYARSTCEKMRSAYTRSGDARRVAAMPKMLQHAMLRAHCRTLLITLIFIHAIMPCFSPLRYFSPFRHYACCFACLPFRHISCSCHATLHYMPCRHYFIFFTYVDDLRVSLPYAAFGFISAMPADFSPVAAARPADMPTPFRRFDYLPDALGAFSPDFLPLFAPLAP